MMLVINFDNDGDLRARKGDEEGVEGWEREGGEG